MPGGGRGGSDGGDDNSSSSLTPETLNIIIPVVIVAVGIILIIIAIIAVRKMRRRHPEIKAYGDQVLGAASSNRSHGTKYFKNSLLPTMWDSLDLGLTHPTFDQPTQFAVNEHENRPSMGGLGELNSITAHGRPSRATMTLNTNDWSSTSSTYSCHTAQQPRYNIVTSSIPNRQVFNPSIETPQYTTPPLTKSSPKPSPPPEENLWRWVLVSVLFCIQTSDWDETGFSSESPRHHPLAGSTPYHPLSAGSDGSEGSRQEVQVRNETSMAADAPVRLREENRDGEDPAQDVREQQAADASPISAPLAGEPQSLEEYIEEYNNRRRPHERQRSSAA
ncbi:MAG: hypothetical protein Q9223_006396 [Gallowayella weberi]